jgi:hypothetical protein
LINKGITQLLFKVGFVINVIWREALELLALKDQSDSKAITPSEIQEKGEFEGGEVLISGWTALRRSLPEGLQQKIVQAEQARQRRDEFELKRRERAAKRQQLRVVDTSVEAHAQLELEIAQQFEGYRVDERRTAIVSEAATRYEVLPLVLETVDVECFQVEYEPIVEVQSRSGQDAEAGRSPHAWEPQEFEVVWVSANVWASGGFLLGRYAVLGVSW